VKFRSVFIFTSTYILLAGCTHKPPIPLYPRTDVENSLAIVRRNVPAAVTLEGTLTLVDAEGQSIQLDIAMAIQDANRLRLRAWKFGQAVFDLTIRPDGIWAYSGRKEFDEARVLALVKNIRPWLALFEPVSPGAEVIREDSRMIELRSKIDNADVRTLIDRPTLTVRSHQMLAQGQSRAAIQFLNYAPFGDIVWPKQIVISDGSRRMEVTTRSVQPTIAPRAFEPPRRARQVVE
jgi:hypothetical protein